MIPSLATLPEDDPLSVLLAEAEPVPAPPAAPGTEPGPAAQTPRKAAEEKRAAKAAEAARQKEEAAAIVAAHLPAPGPDDQDAATIEALATMTDD